jgi:hypothetical protein
MSNNVIGDGRNIFNVRYFFTFKKMSLSRIKVRDKMSFTSVSVNIFSMQYYVIF